LPFCEGGSSDQGRKKTKVKERGATEEGDSPEGKRRGNSRLGKKETFFDRHREDQEKRRRRD